MYFKLPDGEYLNSSREEVLNKLIAELGEFFKSEQFAVSFLAQAKTIRFRTNGQVLWSAH